MHDSRRWVSFDRRQNGDVDRPGVSSFEEDGDPAVGQHGDVAVGRKGKGSGTRARTSDRLRFSPPRGILAPIDTPADPLDGTGRHRGRNSGASDARLAEIPKSASSSPSRCQGAMYLGLVTHEDYSNDHLCIKVRFPFTDLSSPLPGIRFAYSSSPRILRGFSHAQSLFGLRERWTIKRISTRNPLSSPVSSTDSPLHFVLKDSRCLSRMARR